MKIAAIATAAILTASAASAIDLNIGGQTLSIGAEVDANYTTGVETWAIDFVPSAGVTAWGFDFEASSTFDVINLNEGDVFQGLDLEAGYQLAPGLRAYGEVSTDADLEFGDITTGVSFAF